MKRLMIYDKAKYHCDGNLPKKQVYVPTGMFMAWLASNNLLADEIMSNYEQEIQSIKMRSQSPASLYIALDGNMTSDMLTDVGNQFAAYYFDVASGAYLDDYGKVLCGGLEDFFGVSDEWENYDKIAQVIIKRFREWEKLNKNARQAEDLRQDWENIR